MLLSYLVGSDRVTWRDVDEYALLIAVLHEHPRFRFDWTKQVKEGIIAAALALFPDKWRKKE